MAARILVFAFAAATYLFFLAIGLWAVVFTGDLGLLKSMEFGAPELGWTESAVVDAALIALFGMQHSVMARPAFKAALTRWIPAAAERSVYVLASSLALGFLFTAWQPISIALWNFNGGTGRAVLVALFWTGWAMVIASSFLIDHFDLFGLRQAWLFLLGREYTPVPFRDRWAYRVVRHPLMASFLVAFWAAPTMTVGHLLFAGGMTAYILVGVALEERDLLRAFGAAYADYRRRVPMLVPGLRR